MKFRRLTAHYAPALAMTPVQMVELTKVLASSPDTGEDLQATHRGPGGGPDANPYNATKMVLAAMANGPQTHAAAVTFALYTVEVAGSASGAGMRSQGDDLELPTPCVITGAFSFGEAVKAILASPELADTIDRIEARRGAKDACIIARDGRVQRFVDDHDARRLATNDVAGELRVVATIGGRLLTEIARDLGDE